MKLTKNLKAILKNNELTVGSWLSIPSPVAAEIMAQAGFPWLVIDLEHSVIDYETMQSMFVAIENNGSIPLVRLSSKDSPQIKRVLDAGAHGIIAPMINNANDAKKIVSAVKYPPIGNRGVGLARAQGYGMKFESYKEYFNDYSIIICQIEHKSAVDNIEEIVATKGIDGIIIGPYDLSGSYGIPGKLGSDELLEAEKIILEAAARYNIPSGIHIVHRDKSELINKINDGFRIIAYGVDQLFLAKSGKDAFQDIKGQL